MGGPPSGASGRVSIGGPPASAFAGDDYPIALANLGQCLKSQGKHTEAEQLFSRALELRSEVALLASRTGLPEPPHNERHRLTLGALLANCLKAQGRYAEAQPLLRHVVGWWQKQGGGEEARVATAQAMDSLGTCLSALVSPCASISAGLLLSACFPWGYPASVSAPAPCFHTPCLTSAC